MGVLSVRYARFWAVASALFVMGAGFGIALTALFVVDEPPLESREALFYVNSFKFVVGASALFAAGYFELGPEFHERGFATRWLPPADVPLAAILSLLTVGVAALLTSVTVFSRGLGEVLFARTLGFAVLGGGIAAGSVYLYAHSMILAERDGVGGR